MLLVLDDVYFENLFVVSFSKRPQRCVKHLLLNLHRVINKFK